jgi:hypothetical protein
MPDSTVIAWHGPRGSGKTLSMVVQSIIDMVRGRTVWSNMPIVFNYKKDDDSEAIRYEALPLNIDALITQDIELTGGVIVWDEMPLWVHSRSSNAVMNRLVGMILTMLRHRTLSLYLTTQFLSFVDKNVRLQMDAEVHCTDLSFKYRQLERGSTIGQLLSDVSGMFTGEQFEVSHKFYRRTLFGKRFWYCYDSYNTFDILKAQQKVRLNLGHRVISREDLTHGSMEGFDDPVVRVRELMGELKGSQFGASEVQTYLSSNGLPGNIASLGRLIKAAGWTKKRLHNGEYIYTLLK